MPRRSSGARRFRVLTAGPDRGARGRRRDQRLYRRADAHLGAGSSPWPATSSPPRSCPGSGVQPDPKSASSRDQARALLLSRRPTAARDLRRPRAIHPVTPDGQRADLHGFMTDRWPQLKGGVTHAWTGNVAFTFDFAAAHGHAQGMHYAAGLQRHRRGDDDLSRPPDRPQDRRLRHPFHADNGNNSDYFVTVTGPRNRSGDSLAGVDDSAGLAALIERATRAGKGPPPVERWNPAFSGDLDMKIRRDGSWVSGRRSAHPLVELFSRSSGRTKTARPIW